MSCFVRSVVLAGASLLLALPALAADPASAELSAKAAQEEFAEVKKESKAKAKKQKEEYLRAVPYPGGLEDESDLIKMHASAYLVPDDLSHRHDALDAVDQGEAAQQEFRPGRAGLAGGGAHPAPPTASRTTSASDKAVIPPRHQHLGLLRAQAARHGRHHQQRLPVRHHGRPRQRGRPGGRSDHPERRLCRLHGRRPVEDHHARAPRR